MDTTEAGGERGRPRLGPSMLGPIHGFGSGCFFVFGLIYLAFVHSPYLFVSNCVFGALGIANWFLLPRRLGPTIRAGSFLTIVYLGLVNVAVHLGAEPLPMVFWGMSIAIAAAFLFRLPGALAWVALSVGFYPLTAWLKAGPLADRVIPLDGFQVTLLAVASYVGLLSFLAYSFVLFRQRLDRAVDALRAQDDERHRLEARLFQSQKLESLGVLAGGIAHDFNNLLTAILGNMTLARTAARGRPDVVHPLQQAELAALRAAELTHQMLSFSGRGQFVIQPVDLGAALREMVELLKTSLSGKIEFRFELDPDTPPVMADASQLRQVFMNLIINAAEAVGEVPGRITLRTAVRRMDDARLATGVSAGRLPEGPYSCVEVEDTGCGMDEHVQARLFDPFFTTKFTGRGLGLAAVLGIVKGHHGAIWLASAPGLGTTFTLAFPCAAEGLVRAAAAKPTPVPRTRVAGRVLVVDDEPVVRQLVRAVLEAEGFEVVEAADGVAALSWFQGSDPSLDAVLLDLTMPRMDGVETFAELRRIAPGLRVVLMSGYTRANVLKLFPGARPDDFLSKPFRPEDLVAVVEPDAPAGPEGAGGAP